MRRVISVFLPRWASERRERRRMVDGSLEMPAERPGVLVAQEGAKRIVAAVNAAGETVGLAPGIALAKARAVVPDLTVIPADPLDDLRGLERLAAWCLRYSPTTAAAPPDGLWIDASGLAHLFGGEAGLLRRIAERLGAEGLSLRLAMADTPGAAWALARYGDERLACLPSGAERQILGALPPEALRLSVETARGLRRLGFLTIADLLAASRATLALRFGEVVTRRLDQALGRIPEAIDPILPPEVSRARVTFVEPIATAEAIECGIERLALELCAKLEARRRGARRLDLASTRVDGRIERQRVGTARPSRDPLHLARLLSERIEAIEPGFGIEAMMLTAWVTEPLAARQISLEGQEERHAEGMARLVEHLANRLGPQRIYRWRPVASDLPERAAICVPALESLKAKQAEAKEWLAAWPGSLPRPIHLFPRPEPLEVLAQLPNDPPSLFRWRGHLHRVLAADGPERICAEWWQAPEEVMEVRDYFQVEDADGGRWWIYRDSRAAGEGGPRWYLHGVFG